MNYKLKNKKLIKSEYSFLITVPKIWLLQHGLENGGSVKIEMLEDGTLLLKPLGGQNDQH